MTQDEVNLIIDVAQDDMKGTMTHLGDAMLKIRTGKANVSLLDGILVEYYGAPTPLKQVANVSTTDSRTITVQPWEKNIIADVERAIINANLGINPQNDGEIIRLSIPQLTEERRRDLVKRAKAVGEDHKIRIRSARQSAMDDIKNAVKDGLPEDIGKRSEARVQGLTDSFIKQIDEFMDAKESDIMTV